MAKTNVKIEVPGNSPDALIALGEKIDKKNTELDGESPLRSLNMTALKDGLSVAKTKKEQARELRRQAEKLNEEADLALGLGKTQNSKTPDTVLNIITAARDVLLGINRGKEEALGDWGFKVVSGSAAKKITTAKTTGK
jgi:hypothetical protein